MFEFKTAMHAIPYTQLLVYYLVLLTLYVFFLRNVKPTLTSMVLMLLFNQGFILLIDDQGVSTKVLFIVLTFFVLMKSKFRTIDKRERIVLIFSVFFAVLFYLNYVSFGVSLLWASYQYYKFFVPIALYFGFRGLNLKSFQLEYYAKLIVRLMWFQIAFSVVKIVLLGLRENITGSISDTGGNIGITFAVFSVIIYWLLKGKEIKGRDWWFVLLVLIIPAASNKRAIWFLYPIILAFLLTNSITERTIQKISITLILIPIVFYVGLRLNPTLNPERRLWGSYNPDYAVHYALSYSGVTEEKLDSDLASGRWGTAISVLSKVFSDPLSRDNLIGLPRERSGRLDYSEVNPESYGIASGTMLSGIAMMVLFYGWPASLLLILSYLTLIRTIPDRRTRATIAFFVLWDTFLYSGTILTATTHTIILVFTIIISQKLSYTELYTTKREVIYDNNTIPKKQVKPLIPGLQTSK